MMKERYIELMERTLSAYSDEHIESYFNDVKTNGLKEHGFPRLTADIGILIAHGRRHDLMAIFLEMMDFCCKTIPKVKAANDFSVREIVACLNEIEESGAVDSERLERWKADLKTIDPITCYDTYAKDENDKVRNWALFTCLSEFFRQKAGLCNSEEFIDMQILSQFRWLDENGMYLDGGIGKKGIHMDAEEPQNHHPINYDVVPKGLFALLLDAGYRGKYYAKIDEMLRTSALNILKMQSPNGDMAFGGRSNQFLFCELWMIVIYEHEAKRYVREGDPHLAAVFKAASKRTLAVTEYGLGLDPICHIKNRFPIETEHGCEDYAYFNKYMITVASNLHAAYLICDDSIPAPDIEDVEPQVFKTSSYFHKAFLKAGGYGIEFDFDADPHYDARGLGRVQRANAPSAICMSLPCPKSPVYVVTGYPATELSLSAAVKQDGEWIFAVDEKTKYDLKELYTEGESAKANIVCTFENGKQVSADYKVSESGLEIGLNSDGELAFSLPAFLFDGEEYTTVTKEKNSLTIEYKGWVCKYESSGEIYETETIAPNRSGYYKKFFTSAQKSLYIHVDIFKK